jgi:tetratricopeptide (TPR) repeat protein
VAKIKGRRGFRLIKELGGAVRRETASKTARFLDERRLLRGRVLDYGCGFGFDADHFGWEAYDPHYRQALGWALYATESWQESIDAFHKSMDLQQDPKGGDSGQWFGLAAAHARLGAKEEARRWYDRAVQWMENMPDNVALRRFRGGSGTGAGPVDVAAA